MVSTLAHNGNLGLQSNNQWPFWSQIRGDPSQGTKTLLSLQRLRPWLARWKACLSQIFSILQVIHDVILQWWTCWTEGSIIILQLHDTSTIFVLTRCTVTLIRLFWSDHLRSQSVVQITISPSSCQRECKKCCDNNDISVDHLLSAGWRAHFWCLVFISGLL